jgi:oligosaccharide repeat unit polymerase
MSVSETYRLLRTTLLKPEPVRPKLGLTSLTVFFIFMGGFLFLFAEVDGRSNWSYSALHFLIIGISLLHIMWVRRYNLGASFSLFNLIFFGLIPLFEYRLGITYNDASIPRDSSYVAAAELVLLSSFCFYLGYGLRRGTTPAIEPLKKMRFLTIRHRQLILWLTFTALVVCAISIVAFYEFSVRAILLRGYGEELDQNSIGIAFIQYIARPLFFNLVFIMVLACSKRRPVPHFWIFVLICSVLFLVSPVGIPRNLVGALYIPLLMLAFLPKYYSKYSVICVILFAILLAAPLVDVFRHVNVKDSVDLGENYNVDYLFSGHFDAFHNLTQVIELDYRSEGWQLVGILLFWVPRALWEGKPQGTAFDFADFAGYQAHNVSFPLPAEFYVDFGVIGVAFGMFFVGVLYRRLDIFLAKPKEEGSIASYIFYIAHLELSILALFLLRGSVIATFAYTVGLGSTLVIISTVERSVRGLCVKYMGAHE